MSLGASPSGVRPGDEAEASRRVREMFGRVAPRYDLLNRLLSARIDHYWRRVLVHRTAAILERPEARVLDLCCGTGDVLLALEGKRRRLHGGKEVQAIGSDFSRPMLDGATRKLRGAGAPAALVEADATLFPLADESVDLITIAFGFRNLASYRGGLEEFYRLLRPGGCLAILEFSRPTNPIWGPLFEFYFRNVLPRVGNAISGAGDAYSYLQHSVERFWTPQETEEQMRDVGYISVERTELTGGIACLHLGTKGQ